MTYKHAICTPILLFNAYTIPTSLALSRCVLAPPYPLASSLPSGDRGTRSVPRTLRSLIHSRRLVHLVFQQIHTYIYQVTNPHLIFHHIHTNNTQCQTDQLTVTQPTTSKATLPSLLSSHTRRIGMLLPKMCTSTFHIGDLATLIELY
jgi:hypothetical protein